MRLIGYKRIEGKIEVITGLHIGGSATIIEIGGKDNPVIKHPMTKEPYIPGSSIKGKMRALLEWNLGRLDPEGEVHSWCGDKGCPICLIFGTSAQAADIGPTRLIVRDAVLDEDYKKGLGTEGMGWSPISITEDKYENTINRITARANPRNFERVVAGVEFSFSMSYRVFTMGDNGSPDEDLFQHVLNGMRLLENDTLGGAGSRGCGQVKFHIRTDEGQIKSLDQVHASDFPTARME
jgi:CRISPR-associated protein Csm3